MRDLPTLPLAAALTGAIALAGTALSAQQAELDAAFSYAARTTIERSDNDLARLSAGLTFPDAQSQLRIGGELGVLNEDFDDASLVGGLEMSFLQLAPQGRYGPAARLRYADELSTTGEILYAIQRFTGPAFDIRGLGAVQAVADEDEVAGRSAVSPFGLLELTAYAGDDLALSASYSGDLDGDIGGLGIEYRPPGWTISLFAEWGVTLSGYRDNDGYNDLTGGIRFIPGGGTVKSTRRTSPERVFSRPVEVQ